MESPVLKGNFEVGRGAPGGPRRAGWNRPPTRLRTLQRSRSGPHGRQVL